MYFRDLFRFGKHLAVYFGGVFPGEFLKPLVEQIILIVGDDYAADIQSLLGLFDNLGFPGLVGNPASLGRGLLAAETEVIGDGVLPFGSQYALNLDVAAELFLESRGQGVGADRIGLR